MMWTWLENGRERKKLVRLIAILANVHKVAANARLCVCDIHFEKV